MTNKLKNFRKIIGASFLEEMIRIENPKFNQNLTAIYQDLGIRLVVKIEPISQLG